MLKLLQISYAIILSLFFIVNFSFASGTASVLVLPFENMSKYKSIQTYVTGQNDSYSTHTTIDRFSEMPRAMIEDIFLNMGVSIVERQQLSKIMRENDFVRLSGLVRTEDAIRVGKMLGAKFICLGSIVDMKAKTKRFSGYGIDREAVDLTGNIRVRIINIESGKIEFSKILTGGTHLNDMNNSYDIAEDYASEVFTNAFAGLTEDPSLLAFFKKSRITKGD